jgi:ABC-type sugar transport system substrate-binding protein
MCGAATGTKAMETMIAYLRDGTEPADHTVDIAGEVITKDTYADVEKKIAAGEC